MDGPRQQQQQLQALPPAEDDTDNASRDHPSQIDQIIRRKRKVRKARVCYPCRQRKVKCDYGTPCQRCIDREHPDLCSYQQTIKTRELDSNLTSSSTGSGKPPAPEYSQVWSKLEEVQALLQDVKGNLHGQPASQEEAPGHTVEQGSRDPLPASSGVQAPTELGDFVFLGRHSVPAIVMALGSGSDQGVIQDII